MAGNTVGGIATNYDECCATIYWRAILSINNLRYLCKLDSLSQLLHFIHQCSYSVRVNRIFKHAIALEGGADDRGVGDAQLLPDICLRYACICDYWDIRERVFDQPQCGGRCLLSGGQTRNAQGIGSGVKDG